MNPIIIDLILGLIFLFFLIRGSRRGLVASLTGLLSFFVALLGASLIARACTPVVAEWIAPSVETALTERMQTAQNEDPDMPLPDDAAPDAGDAADASEESQNQLADTLRRLGFYQPIAQSVANTAQQQANAAQRTIAGVLSLALSSVIAYWGLFLLGSIVLRIALGAIVRGLKLLVRLPILSQLNRIGGLLLGLVQGLAVLFLIAWIIGFLGAWIPEETMEQTTLLRWFSHTNPFALLSF